MKTNTISKIIAGTFLGIKMFTSSIDVIAQSADISEAKKKEILNAYDKLDAIAKDPKTFNSNAFMNSYNQRVMIEDFLGAQSGLYNGSSAGIETTPPDGRGSVKLIMDDLWVDIHQIGSGYGKRPEGKFDAEVITSRDMSYTWALYARRAGYDNSSSEKSFDRLKSIISLNTGIPPQDMKVEIDNVGNVTDVLYTERVAHPEVSIKHPALGETKTATEYKTVKTADDCKDEKQSKEAETKEEQSKATGQSYYYPFFYPGKDKNANPSNMHDLVVSNPSRYKTPSISKDGCPTQPVKYTKVISRGADQYHILMKPGKDFQIPLNDALEIAGIDVDAFYYNLEEEIEREKPQQNIVPTVPNGKQDLHKKNYECFDCKDEIEMIYDEECHDCNDWGVDRDSLEFRMGIVGAGTSTGVPVLGIYTQLGKCQFFNRFDLELSAGDPIKLNGAYNFETLETLKHPQTGLTGNSKLQEKGLYDIKSYMAKLMLVRYINERNTIALRAGIQGQFTKENVDGDELRTTWYDTPHGGAKEYDETTRDIALRNKSKIELNPVIGAQLSLSPRIRFFVDRSFGTHPYVSNYAPESADFGKWTTGVIFDFGPGKHDRKYSNPAVNKQRVADQKEMREQYSYPKYDNSKNNKPQGHYHK